MILATSGYTSVEPDVAEILNSWISTPQSVLFNPWLGVTPLIDTS